MADSKGPVAGQHLFTPISHPVLRKATRKNIRNFLHDRENYLLQIQDANNSGAKVQPISIVSSVERDLLQSLIYMDEFKGVEEFSQLNDDILKEWLERHVATDFDSLTVDQLSTAIQKHVRINIHEADPKLRIIALFTDFVSFLRSRKWEDLIDNNPELAIEHVCSLLNPIELKEKIESDIELYKHSIKKKWKLFYKHVIKRAIACDEFIPIYTPKAKNGKNGKSSDHKKKNHGLPTKAKSEGETKKSQQKILKCLNPECSEHHLLKHCKNTSSDKKKALFEQYKKTKVRFEEKSSKPRSGQSSNEKKDPSQEKSTSGIKAVHLPPSLPDGIYSSLLMDKVPVIANGDYGADHSVLSENHLQEFAKANIFVPTLPLIKPLPISLAITGDDKEPLTFYARKKARLSLTLNTHVGPLRLRNVEFLVFNEKLPEVLLSRPVLNLWDLT